MTKKPFSFTDLLTRLIGQAPNPTLSQNASANKPQKVGTTIRITEDTRIFFETQAENLGVSLQDCISMTLHAVMRASYEPQSTQLDLQVDRFFLLFEAHNIPMTDVSILLASHSTINREDLLSRGRILNKLEPELLEHLANLFKVNLNWLKGLDETIHCDFTLYKNPEIVARHIAILKRKSRHLRIHFVGHDHDIIEKLNKASSKGDSTSEVHIGVVIEYENIVNGIPFTTYNVFESGLRWNYWPCRRDIKSIIMFCDKKNIRCNGVIISKQHYDLLFDGKIFAPLALKTRSQLWYPDELVWNDDRNTERAELNAIKDYYKERKMDKIQQASNSLATAEEWKKFEEGVDIEDLLKKDG